MIERGAPHLPQRRRVLEIGTKLIAGYAATRLLTACGESPSSPEIPTPYWSIRSVDTMKQSRDNARLIGQRLNNPEQRIQMLSIINHEVRNIALLNSTHVAIGTPYNDEFLPVAQAYFLAAHNNGLNVWWRSNFSEFEKDSSNPNQGWFGYQHNPNFMPIPAQNGQPAIPGQPGKIREFIQQNGHMFRKGDIFTPWPEAENTIDFYNNPLLYQQLLLDDYAVTQPLRDKGVLAGYFSMNGDVAKRLDPGVVKQIGNVVVIDHYVRHPDEMGDEIDFLHQRYPGAQIVIGEFGAPIPDLNGYMNPQQQAKFVGQLLDQIKSRGSIIKGLNYWVDIQSSTQFETSLTNFLPVYNVLRKTYGASAKAQTR